MFALRSCCHMIAAQLDWFRCFKDSANLDRDGCDTRMEEDRSMNATQRENYMNRRIKSKGGRAISGGVLISPPMDVVDTISRRAGLC